MDSPFKQYLGTNYSPTAVEARGVQLVIDATAQEIVALDAQIEEVQRQLDSLQRRRSTIGDFVKEHRALLSPARKLTPDILEDIFIACLPSDRNPCMSSSEAPMLLTQICSPWRQIAMSAPRLWAAIHIVIPNIRLEPHPAVSDVERKKNLVYCALKRREVAISEWLGRSGVCPLSISMYEVLPWIGHNTSDEPNASILKDIGSLHLMFIVNTIIPYHQQWRELDICLGDDTLDRVLDIGLKAGSLKALNSLHVTCKKVNDRSKYQWRDVVELLPPHATSATFSDFVVRTTDIPSIPHHVWKGLTDLTLTLSNDATQAFTINIVNIAPEILVHCHSLVTLTLTLFINHFHTLEGSGDENTDIVVIPHLTTLNISLPPSSEGVTIAKRLSLPSLTEMSVQFSRHCYSIETALEIFESLLVVGGHVHTLNICEPNWMKTSEDLVHILKKAPDLKRLTITNKKIYSKWDHPVTVPGPLSYVQKIVTDNLLQALTPFEDGDADIICPMLEEFVCSQDLITGITERGLKDFLKARTLDPCATNIRRISLFINDYKTVPLPEDERISLGTDSAVFFRKSTPVSMTPFGGYKPEPLHFIVIEAPIEVYTEL